jgi:peptidoglycan/LPS O-acetylase OafA/YrhL
MSTPGPATPSGRVLSIDGMRGLAATLVMLFHIHAAVSRTATDWLWAPLDFIARHGALGVDFFFVISGFVIALSVSRGDPTPSYFGRFILRRSIRLDPPYWTAIALEVGLIYLTLQLFANYPVVKPSTPQLVAHVFYAQEILGYGSVTPVFWTLCYEIQFYLFYVGLVVLRDALPRPFQARQVAVVVCAALFLLSLYVRFTRPAWVPYGVALDRWFQFFVGVLTYYAVTVPGQLRLLYAGWATVVAMVLASGAHAVQLLVIPVSAWLVLSQRDVRWGAIFATRPLRFLGLISYSLYLYHSSIGWRFVSLAQRLFPGPWEPPMAITVYLVAIGFSTAVSAALWWAIERPFLNLCHRVKLPLKKKEPLIAAPVVEATVSS